MHRLKLKMISASNAMDLWSKCRIEQLKSHVYAWIVFIWFLYAMLNVRIHNDGRCVFCVCIFYCCRIVLRFSLFSFSHRWQQWTMHFRYATDKRRISNLEDEKKKTTTKFFELLTRCHLATQLKWKSDDCHCKTTKWIERKLKCSEIVNGWIIII